MASNLLKTFRRAPSPAHTDIVAYRHDDKLVYVPMTLSYTQALSYAREAFPQLRELSDASLSFSLTSQVHKDKCVYISASVWAKLAICMARYQVIDVHVAQPDVIDSRKGDVFASTIALSLAYKKL